jgi:hypothetical protein
MHGRVSLSDSVDAGVFVLGMHRSGTSAVTGLVSLLGLQPPREGDLVPPSAKNPKGYWESMSLVSFNTRVLHAVGSEMSCPIAVEPGWEADPRLDPLRLEAPAAVRSTFPSTPWIWKDPRNCLTFSFWRDVLDVRPVVMLVNRNPLEIAASALRTRPEQGKVYALALWERYLRQGLEQAVGLPLFATNYDELLADPVAWCERAHAFLTRAEVPAQPPTKNEVLSFADTALKNAKVTRDEFLADGEVSEQQRALFVTLERLEGEHDHFALADLTNETPTTEALLKERRRANQLKRELDRVIDERERAGRWSRILSSEYVVPVRRVYASLRRLSAPPGGT